jgi:hypothetical protein
MAELLDFATVIEKGGQQVVRMVIDWVDSLADLKVFW